MINQLETRAREAIRESGPLNAFNTLIAENDGLIRSPELGNGRLIAAARSAVYTGLVQHWAAAQHRLLGYDKPFAVVALGGTGRAEMAPFSDNDFAFLFDDVIEGNQFLLELQRQVVHSDDFKNQYAFDCQALPFNLDDMARLSGKQLNSFLDMRPVYDPDGLSSRFRERIRSTFDPFEHFLHVRGFWKAQWEKAAGGWERLDGFDVKNEGLRVFLAGVWTLAGEKFIHSHEVYQTVEDSRDLEAYDLLLRVRAFVHSRRKGGAASRVTSTHPEDVLLFDDYTSFGEMLGPGVDDAARFEFANDLRARLLSARRRVAGFTKRIIERELKDGREAGPGSPIVFGVGGLYHTTSHQCRRPREKSQAALSLLLASQRYGVPIDPSELQVTFRNVGDWLELVPELSALFYEQRGSLAESFTFLSQVDGAQDRLFPGYAKFEASIDSRVMRERSLLRGALERQKTRILEQWVREGRTMLSEAVSSERVTDISHGLSLPVEAALLDTEHLAAVKLALKTKRLPLLPEDLRLRLDESLPLHERFSSGMSDIPISEYYVPYGSLADFTPDTLRVTEFLVVNRRAFKERAELPITDKGQVDEVARLCQDEQLLRSLFVFTCADRAEWDSEKVDPARWFHTRELYSKTMRRFKPDEDPTRSLKNAGFSREQLTILKDFGEDFFTGVYRQYANRFGGHLVDLAEAGADVGPRVNVLRDGASIIIGVAARDYRGVAAVITGALWHQGIQLRMAHLFSATTYGLALDFFHIAPGDKAVGPELSRFIEDAIRRRLYISDSDEAGLPEITGNKTLLEWRPGQCCLRVETAQDAGGLVYALTYKVFRHLRGNIFGLAAHVTRGRAYVSVYHSLPSDLSLESARAIVAERF